LIKGSEALENAQKVTSVIFDKTGTLTVGKPSVTNLRLLKKFSSQSSAKSSLRKIFALIGMTESNSDHPIAVSVQAYSRALLKMNKDASFGNCEQFNSESGLGVNCVISNEAVNAFFVSLQTESPTESATVDLGLGHSAFKNVSHGTFLAADIENRFTFEQDWLDSKEYHVLIGNRKLLQNAKIAKYDSW